MNKNEQEIFDKYETLGYDVIKDGIPDILLLKDGKIEFVEVKYKNDNLNPRQVRAFALLKKHKVPVRLERIPFIRKSSLLEKWMKQGDKIVEM